MPFAGCPNRCSFCDQKIITGKCIPPTKTDVKISIETAINSGTIDTKESEIAFFGGSFTAIEEDYMVSLLSAAKEYLHLFKGIRISTRPDCINKSVLEILRDYGVTSIELGAQSMCDKVLKMNNRGHDSDSVRHASALIKNFGFSLGLQMMTGLYGSTEDDDVCTAREFIKLKPDTVRIYPTVILSNTELGRLYQSGEYNTYSLDDTVSLCARLILMFEDENISVIRVGLHSSDTMKSEILSGAYHPAFKELCENQIFLNLIENKLSDLDEPCRSVIVRVANEAVSKATGQKRKNIIALSKQGYDVKIIADKSLSGRQIIIQEG